MPNQKFLGHVLFLAVVIAVLISPHRAEAALTCGFSMPNVDFGTVNVAQNTTFVTTSTVSVNCTGGTASAVVRTCVVFGDGGGGAAGAGAPRYMKSGANTLTYNLYQDAGYATIWGNGGAFGTRAEIDVTLNGSGNGSATKTLYARVDAGQQSVPQGSYTSDFPAYHVLSMYGYTNQGDCPSGNMPSVTPVPTFTVNALNSSSCTVSASAHDFGTFTNLSSNRDTTSTVTVTCSNGTPYNIGLGVGNGSGATIAARKMTSGANTITYSLYSNTGRTTVWGTTIGTNTVSATATGYGQNTTVYGRVPVQTTPPIGTYTDTVVVTVTY